jgi:hypothetical protein
LRNYPETTIYDVQSGEILAQAPIAPSRVRALLRAYNHAGIDAVIR